MISPWARRQAKRDRAAARAALPDAIELIIVGIRAGLAPAAAFTMATDHSPPVLRPAFVSVVTQMHRGQRFADALGAVPDWLGPHAAYVTDALSTADRYGLPLEPILDRLTTDVRTDRARLSQQHARTLPVRLAFPLVTCTLPSFVLLAIVPAVLGAVSTLRA